MSFVSNVPANTENTDKKIVDAPKLFPKPRGRAPKNKSWNPETGVWEDIPAELTIRVDGHAAGRLEGS